ncbi:MFS general substrate transporter [Rhizophagus irregularis]|uniref:MFS general substrate transporter n=1 Tax=Rhizophagus irregularis TaxID=588596 RepID=A0A2I1E0V8_9GLOM|nr:MFS general substrate transporter [Rhizophagus irregularis]PKY15760.1 MFS general substrate transporter [Rhizophagus irregularis]
MKSIKLSRKTLSFISALLISSLCGTQYAFSVYSTSVAERLGFSSVQINTIGSSANYGLFFFGPFFGYIVDTYPSRIIPMLASITIFTGYFCLAMTYQGYFPNSFLLCVFYLLLTGIASCAAHLSSMGTISTNIKSYRGIAFGASMALFGLTAFIFSQINSLFFRGDTYHFLLFTAITTGVFIFIGSIFLVRVPQEESHEEIISPSEENSSTSSASLNNEERTPLLSRHEESDVRGRELFQNIDAMILGLTLLLIGGVGLMYMNNVGAIVKSLYLSTSTHPLLIDEEYFSSSLPSDHDLNKIQEYQNFHVTLLSLFSCSGRISVGLMSDLSKNMYNVRRLWFLLAASLYILIGQILAGFMIKDLNHLWISSTFIGFGYGHLFGISPTITNEWFGKIQFVLNWYFISFGGQLFNLFFGYNFDKHKNDCSGLSCYNTAFYVSTIGSMISLCVVSTLLFKRRNQI